MDNSTPISSTTSDIGASNPNNRDQFLRHLNKLSHSISKPSSSSFKKPNLPEPTLVLPPQQQPPVYNISKSDFRNVVQRLTGSPAHAPSSTPPITHAPKPSTSSRLHRIRPTPLAQLSLPNNFITNVGPSGPPPHSPLPPLPSCHAAAESPISAYMRFIHNTTNMDINMKMIFPPLENFSVSSAGGGCGGGDFSTFGAPLPFGCLPSPKSPCPLLSPKLMMPPLSPTVPGVPSPK